MTLSPNKNDNCLPLHTLAEKFGVEYYVPGRVAVTGSRETDLYNYKTFIGAHTVNVEKGDCAYVYDAKGLAYVQSGPVEIQSTVIATVIRGYTPPARSVAVGRSTNLPYVNGCSTRQILTPERVGDPTLQLLHIPPHSSEQVHHIHSTARVVHVLEGRGRCVVGMKDMHEKHDLIPGMSLVLHPMCPHHFETDGEALWVLPLHVFSSPPAGVEFNHPMYNGTHQI